MHSYLFSRPLSQNFVLTIIRNSFRQVIEAEEFKVLSMPELEQYLDDLRDLGVCSDDLLRGVIQWIEYDTGNRSVHMPAMFTMVPVGKCNQRFILEMMEENSELLDLQEHMYKLMLTDVLHKVMPKAIGEEKTVLILGGETSDKSLNPHGWILQEDKLVDYCNIDEECGIKPYHSVCPIPGGLLLTGGVDTDTCVIFYFSDKRWVAQQPMLTARHRHCSGYVNGKVFVICGKVLDDVVDYVDSMNLEQNLWTREQSVLMAARFPKVIPFKASLFVLVTSKCNMFQLDTDDMIWRAKSPLPQSSYGCSLAASDDRIYAAGGDNNITCVYIPTSDTWCQLTGPSIAERQGSMVYYQKKLYLFGGCRRDEDMTDVEEYDISGDRWSLTQWKLPAPLYLHCACIVDVLK